MSIRRTTTLGTVAGLVLAFAATGPAAAQGEATLIPCFGEQEVTPGNYDLFATGWGTGSLGALRQFLKSQTTLVTVTVDDGDPVTTNLTNGFGAPHPFDIGEGPSAWASDLIMPLGELESGQTLTVSVVSTLSKPIVDFFKRPTPVDPSNLKAGDSPVTGSCTITVT
jgi:hypothetical protein